MVFLLGGLGNLGNFKDGGYSVGVDIRNRPPFLFWTRPMVRVLLLRVLRS